MQVFVRDAATLAFDVEDGCTVEQLTMLFTQRAFGVDAAATWMLLFNGRQLPDSITMAAAGISPGSTLYATSRVRGGGGDGGSTGAESRSCYLEMYKQQKADKINPAEELLARWTRCHLSGEQLAQPIVADELGFLYNKEALVSALLNKTMPASLSHITGLKSLISVKAEDASSKSSSSAAAAAVKAGPSNGRNGSSSSSNSEYPFQCPVTSAVITGRGKVWVHRPTGWLISDKALREVPAAAEELLGGKVASGDLLLVNPAGQELEEARERLQAKLASSKKSKKQKRSAEEAVGAAAAAAVEGAALPPLPGQAANGSSNGVAAAKKLKVPEGATPEVWASLFNTGKEDRKETFCCRSVSGRTAY